MKKKNVFVAGGVLAAGLLALGTGSLMSFANGQTPNIDAMVERYMVDIEPINYEEIHGIDFNEIDGFEILDFDAEGDFVEWFAENPSDMEGMEELMAQAWAILDATFDDFDELGAPFMYVDPESGELRTIDDVEFLREHVFLNDGWTAIVEVPEDVQSLISEIDFLLDEIADASAEEVDSLYENPRLEELLTQLETRFAELENES